MSEDEPEPRKKQGFWSSALWDVLSQPIWDGLCYLVVGVFRLMGEILAAVLEVLPW